MPSSPRSFPRRSPRHSPTVRTTPTLAEYSEFDFAVELARSWPAGTPLPAAGSVYPPALRDHPLPTGLSNASGTVARYQYSLRCNPAKLTEETTNRSSASLIASSSSAANDRFDIAPRPLLSGTDVFTYTVTAVDATGVSSNTQETNLMSIRLLRVNHPPAAATATFAVSMDVAMAGSLAPAAGVDGDGHAVRYKITAPPSARTVVFASTGTKASRVGVLMRKFLIVLTRSVYCIEILPRSSNAKFQTLNPKPHSFNRKTLHPALNHQPKISRPN